MRCMVRTRIKFCGMMTIADAHAAAQAGADAVGMILHSETRRKIEIDLARQIVEILPPFVTPVGVFVDAPAQRIINVAQRVELRTVQLHGNETTACVAAVAPIKVIKAIKTNIQTVREVLAKWKEDFATGELANLDAILLEAPVAAPGGTGAENDFDLVAQLQAEGAFGGLPPMIVAGGLRPENVQGVVEKLRPYGVDVSTGIEDQSGKKSLPLMQAFAEGALRADIARAQAMADLQ